MTNKEKIEAELGKIDFKPGQLHKLSSKKIFWIDGKDPAVVQYMTDEDEKVVAEYISGRSGWESVEKDSILLFLGLCEIEITGEEEEQELLEEKYFVLKWLFDDKVLFWSFDGLDGEEDTKLENIFDVVGQQEIPNL